jgi:hypothetical protein
MSDTLDYAGSVFSGNVIERSEDGVVLPGSTSRRHARGLSLENNARNVVVRDNVFYRTGAECIKVVGSTQYFALGGSINNSIFNNLMIECGRTPDPDTSNRDDGGILIHSNGQPTTNNVVYNNVFVNTQRPAIMDRGCSSTSCAGTIFRNNIIYSAAGGQPRLIDWVSAVGLFENNIVVNAGTVICETQPTATGCTSTNLINWRGGGVSCNGISSAGIGNKCVDPDFRSIAGLDFRTLPKAPGLDQGTSGNEAAYPAARTAAMSNALIVTAGENLFPRLDEGAAKSGNAWDIGAFESRAADPDFENGDGAGWVVSDEGCAVSGATWLTTLAANGIDPDPAYIHSGSAIGFLRGKVTGPECGSFAQTLANLDTARTYTIFFYYQAEGAAAGDKALDVTIDAVSKCTVITNTAAPGWTYKTGCTFTPAGATAVLKFLKPAQAAGTTIYRIDGVDVVATN